jgi:hypothetical protein
VTNVQGRILAICLALVTACYSPQQPDCGFVCARGECPSDYFCAPDGICHRNGTSPTTSCAIDARVDSPRPIDAPLPDADVTPPSVLTTLPQANATNVPTSDVVRVQFSEPVLGVDVTNFRLSTSTASIPGGISPSDPRNWTFIPQSLLPASTLIFVELTSTINDYSGNALIPHSFTFTTGT